MTLTDIREFVAVNLPERYEPLLMTFYGRASRAAGDTLLIGDDKGTQLRVLRSGRVVSVDPGGRNPTRFLNSSVEHLARFIQLLMSSDSTSDQVERRLWEELARIDPVAFEDAENLWFIVREQAISEMP